MFSRVLSQFLNLPSGYHTVLRLPLRTPGWSTLLGKRKRRLRVLKYAGPVKLRSSLYLDFITLHIFSAEALFCVHFWINKEALHLLSSHKARAVTTKVEYVKLKQPYSAASLFP